jgi:hypothetical protein
VDRAELEEYLRDRPWRLAEHLEGDAAHRREAIEKTIILLHKERWRLWMRLVTPYFCADPRPELVEVWRNEASESVARRMALADHEDAMDFLLGYLE